VTGEDILTSNLVLWGDPGSNRVLGRMVTKLPITWNVVKVGVGKQAYSTAGHLPTLIYPNPLNPRKYVVINSGFTFREFDYLNNARQIPKLPDYAILDLAMRPDGRWPARIAHAGFFNEEWEPAETAPEKEPVVKTKKATAPPPKAP
jgi:hypothetical protein